MRLDSVKRLERYSEERSPALGTGCAESRRSSESIKVDDKEIELLQAFNAKAGKGAERGASRRWSQ